MESGNTKRQNKLYAFWKYDIPPYLLGGEVIEVMEDGYVTIKGYTPSKFKPIKIVPLEKGIKLQKKLDKARAKYKKTIQEAEKELKATVNEISK